MKKIIKLFSSFFRAINRFIDKRIVLPITKLVARMTTKFDKSGKKLENWLSQTNTLLFISLILAIGIFIIIDRKIIVFANSSAEVIKNQPIEVIYNEEAYVVEGLPETVDITLIGSKTDLYIARQSSSHKVTVDLSGMEPGTHRVNIEYNQNTGSIDYMVNPSVATVIIYPKVSETRTLTVDLLNKDELDSKLVIQDIDYDTDKVVIKGAEHQLKKVAEVKALVDVKNIVSQEVGKQKLKDVPLRAYDVEGNVVDVEIVPGKIDVELDIDSPSKELPIKIIPKGEVNFGLAISAINSSESKVIAYGKSDVLNKLKYIPVEIDVNNLKESKEYKKELVKPVGVKSLSVSNITINVSLDSVASKDIDDINIEYKNLGSDYTVQGTSESATKVSVGLKGVKSVIDSIKSDDVTAYIDLNGYKEGEYEVAVKVTGSDNKVSYTSKTKKVKIKIVKK